MQAPVETLRPKPLSFLTGDSAMVARIRAFDWGRTPIGDPDQWPPELIAAASFVLESRFPAALVWGPELTTIYNDGFRPILGEKPEALGRSFRDVWAEAWARVGPIVERAFDGQASFTRDFPLVINRYGYPETAYFTFSYSPVRSASGAVLGMIDTVVETTESVLSRERAQFLNDELGRRLRTMMSMVRIIAVQSLGQAADPEAVAAFSDRIHALGQANDILLENRRDSAPIGAIVARMVAPHGGRDRFVVSGEPIDLGPNAALSLAMLLHELAINANRHGALAAGGTVRINWRIDGDELLLTWRETGGPPVRAPRYAGFGTRIIDLGMAGAGRVIKQYRETGFEAEFRADLGRLLE